MLCKHTRREREVYAKIEPFKKNERTESSGNGFGMVHAARKIKQKSHYTHHGITLSCIRDTRSKV